MKLTLSDTLKLPAEAVTQTFAVLAKRGAGKTYTASVMAEEMLKAHQQVVAIDPTGAWHGLRSGFPIAIFGGDHGDLPLEEQAGELIATAIVENRFSAVLDLSLFRKGQLIRFMVQFAETLYRLNRAPLHLFVDEADAVAPQGKNFGGEENRMLGAMEDIVRRGRKKGIGCTLITQRPAVLNKNVLTQCESLFALRLTHPRDIDAIMEWINVHAEPQQAKAVVDSLPTLAIGECWFWSPGWLGLLERVKIRLRETFDSSATPKPGETIRPPKQLASVDLKALGKQIESAAAKAKENDPRELRKRIAELERKLKDRPPETVEKVVEKRVEVPVLKNGMLDKALALVDRLQAVAGPLTTAVQRVSVGPTSLPQAPRRQPVPASTSSTRHDPVLRKPGGEPMTNRQREQALEQGPLPIGEQKTLGACIQYPDGLLRNQLTVLTGYKRSTRDAYIARLREKGLVEPAGELVLATAAGLDALPDYEPLPRGRALQDWWRGRLPQGELAVLNVLIEAHPNGVARDAIDEATGFKRSTRDAYLSRLAAKQLVKESGRGEVRASDELF